VFIPRAPAYWHIRDSLAKYLEPESGRQPAQENIDLCAQPRADEVIDYKTQQFEECARLRRRAGHSEGRCDREIASDPEAIGAPLLRSSDHPDAAFARARGMNFLHGALVRMANRKIIRHASNVALRIQISVSCIRTVGKLAEIGEL